MTQYRFRLTGVPPDQAIKLIEVDPNQSIAEIKKNVQREYKLNPILAIQFIFKGKVLPDNLKFAKIGIHPKKDVITVMATQKQLHIGVLGKLGEFSKEGYLAIEIC
jgi:hypothetical protein